MVHPLLLKECKVPLSRPLLLLWKKSIELGEIPHKLQFGLVTPIHKGDSRSKAKNYRPIVLTSHLIKVLERVLTSCIMEYLEETRMLNNGQHGFRRTRSCLSQLMNHYQNLINVMESGNAADVIYLDFAKAFDKVDHGLLIKKLSEMGISGLLLRWIHAFLADRFQAVKVEGFISRQARVVSGVPQGTILGPILFLLFVGDIDVDLSFALATSFEFRG